MSYIYDECINILNDMKKTDELNNLFNKAIKDKNFKLAKEINEKIKNI